ncbi:MAG: MFS transporter [Pseudomonadota bacterium]
MAVAASLQIFRHRNYRLYWIMRQLVGSSREMQATAIGWQVYDLARETRSVEEAALLLGVVGLAQFLPLLLFSLVGGQAADRYDRRWILAVTNGLRASVAIGLVGLSFLPGDTALPWIFAASAVLGVLNAFMPAASNALFPRLVPREDLPQAIAWNSLAFQTSAMLGPAVAGLLLLIGPAAVYGSSAVMSCLALGAVLAIRAPREVPAAGAKALALIAEGLRYVRDNRIVLGAISLDFVVVFFGGAKALLPVYARDILHVGTEGLGLLAAAPAVGAFAVAYLFAAQPLARRVGKWMFFGVGVYGVATLVFAVSSVFWLSLMAMAVTGAADMISVYVRQSLIQLATPDAMRGRVSAVSFFFISASNELGDFEAGVAARFMGPVGAVILGGVVALAAAAAWMRLFPSLAKADAFEDAAIAEPEPPGAPGRSPAE